MNKNKLKAALLVIVLLSIGILGVYMYQKADKEYVVKINDKAIGMPEYSVYLYEQIKNFEDTGGADIWDTTFDGVSAENVAKQNALNALVFIKTSVSQSERIGLTFLADDLSYVKGESDRFYRELDDAGLTDKMNISYDRVGTIIAEIKMQSKLYETITKGYEPSDIDFDAYVTTYYNDHIKELSEVKILYVYVPRTKQAGKQSAEQTIQQAYNKITGGAVFADVVKEYSQSSTQTVVSLKDMSFSADITGELYKMAKGDNSGILEGDGGYYIFHIVDVSVTNMEALKEKLKPKYIQTKKDEIYKEQSDKWIEKAKIEKNQDVWDRIHIADFKEGGSKAEGKDS